MIKRFLDPKNDFAFKKIFGTEKNKDILIELLNSVLKQQLHRNIIDVTFLNPIQEPNILAKKQSIVDVLCKDSDGCQYIIEMQIANTTGFEARAQYYAYKAFVAQMEQGQPYHGLKKVIFLAFTDFPIFPNKKKYKSQHITLDSTTGEHDLDRVSFIFIDLTKFDQQRSRDISDLTKEERFYYFLRHASSINQEEIDQLIAEGQIMQRALQALDRASWTEEEMQKYEQEEKRQRDLLASYDYAKEEGRTEGKEEGIAIGEAKGIEQGRQAIKKLIMQGVLSKEAGEKALEQLN